MAVFGDHGASLEAQRAPDVGMYLLQSLLISRWPFSGGFFLWTETLLKHGTSQHVSIFSQRVMMATAALQVPVTPELQQCESIGQTTVQISFQEVMH